MAKRTARPTLANLNRLLAEIFTAPKAKIDEAEAARVKKSRPRRGKGTAP